MTDEGNQNDRALSSQEALNRSLVKLDELIAASGGDSETIEAIKDDTGALVSDVASIKSDISDIKSVSSASDDKLDDILEEINNIEDKIDEIIETIQGKNLDFDSVAVGTNLTTGDELATYFPEPGGVSLYHLDGNTLDIRASIILKGTNSGSFYKVRAYLQYYDESLDDWKNVDVGLITYTEDEGGSLSSPMINGYPGVRLEAKALKTHYRSDPYKNNLPRIFIVNDGDDVSVDVSISFDKSALVEVI